MPELLAHVVNIHGIAPFYAYEDHGQSNVRPHFRAHDDMAIRLRPFDESLAGTFHEEDAEFVGWLGSQTSPVWAHVAQAKSNELPVERLTITRASNPWWYAGHGRYTRYEHTVRTFVQLAGEASFPKFDASYTTPIYIARLMLHDVGIRPFASNVNQAQLVQSISASKAKNTRVERKANEAAAQRKQTYAAQQYDRTTVWTY